MAADFVAEARRIADRLRALDRRLVTFGATCHRHQFCRPLSEAQLADFERRHGVELPPPYRAYLRELGNGGPGPYYGVTPLAPDQPQLADPFPHADKVADIPDGELDDPLLGTVEIADYGCGIFMVLVVRGPAAGQVWADARYETGLSPAGESFDSWWLKDMGSRLELFDEIDRLMQRRTDHDTIHEVLDERFGQLQVDETILSILDRDPNGKPTRSRDKPWGLVCGLVDDCYPPR